MKTRECFTGEEVYKKTDGKMTMSFDELKGKLPGANIVNYYDFKSLYKKGQYTPKNIDQTLANY